MTVRRPLRVLVDALVCKPGQSGMLSHGVGVVRGLGDATGVSTAVLTSAPDEFAGIAGVEVVPAPAATRSFVRRAVWRELKLPEVLDRFEADVAIVTAPELPIRSLRRPSAIVVHDLGAVMAPALYPRSRRLRYELLLRGACRRATKVVCVSEWTLLELHRWCGIGSDRCTVIGNAPQVRVPTGGASDGVGAFILLVGNVFTNKNTSTILRALSLLDRRAREANRPAPTLVMVGPLPPNRGERLWREAGSLGITGNIEHRGFVTEADLAVLYRDAAVVLYPSLYEGQGIPVMDAMVAGARVVATDLPPIREFGSGRIATVSRPLEPQAWADAIERQTSSRGRPPHDVDLPTWQEIGQRYAALARELAE